MLDHHRVCLDGHGGKFVFSVARSAKVNPDSLKGFTPQEGEYPKANNKKIDDS
jgi:hypothetical protein